MISLSNCQGCKNLLDFVFEGKVKTPMIESMYITEDKRFVYGGRLNDTLRDPYYKRYVLLYPNATRRLYRLQPIEIQKFWHWFDYLTEAKWRVGYLKVDYDEVGTSFKSFAQTYRPYYGNLPPITSEDSVQVAHKFEDKR